MQASIEHKLADVHHRLGDWFREMLLRLGLFPERARRSLWVHGEGLGEFRLAKPLLRALNEACPGHRLVLTTSRAVTRPSIACRARRASTTPACRIRP